MDDPVFTLTIFQRKCTHTHTHTHIAPIANLIKPQRKTILKQSKFSDMEKNYISPFILLSLNSMEA